MLQKLPECCDKGLACHVNLKTGFHIMPADGNIKQHLALGNNISTPALQPLHNMPTT